ncbi:MAG: hypothetical protein E6J01_00190 [Chloroflexi bacterium]|nr:MAG: hypothetical protein E6J01_00190 [Chloroflexota bacterium]
MTRSAVRFISALGMTAAVVAGATVPAFAAAGTRSLLNITRLPATGTASAYTAQAPNRILDTRSTGTPLTGQTLNLTVAGGTTTVPAAATAVVLNVTVTNTAGAGFLTVWPAGNARPTISNLNWAAGETRPNLVTVTVGTGGQVSLFANSNTDVVVDEEGFYAAPSGTAGGYVAVSPARITDTRAGSGQANAGSTLAAGTTLSVQVTGAGGVPATGVSGVVLNATVTNTSASSFLTAWATGGTMPVVSNLNWVAGWTVPNRVIVPVGTGGKVNFYNKFGSTDLVVDVDGYYTDATAAGKLFTPMTPNRVIDTRLQGGTLGAGQSSTYAVAGFAGVPSGASGVIFNVTVTNTTAASFLTVYPNARPLSSDLNWVAGQTIPNMTQATLSSTGTVSFYNNTGSTDLVVDLSGFFGQAAGVSVTANPASVPADGATTSTITATVTTNTGAPAVSDPVAFSLAGSPSGACGTITPATGTTNTSGTFTSVYKASSTVGTCTITANEAQNGLSGSTTVTQTKVANSNTVTAAPTFVPANGVATSTVTSLVKDSSGALVSGDVVTFVATGSPAAACGSLSASSATTSAAGVASVTYTASTTVGFCTVKATEANTGTAGSATITQTSNPPPGTPNTVDVTVSPASIPADGKTTSAVTATVKAGAAAQPGDPVMFTLTGAACGTISPASGTTNASGVVTATYTASTTAGACAVKATEAISNSSAPSTGTNPTTITQTAVPNGFTATATPASLPANGTSTSTIKATVTNGVTGAAVSGDAVTFAATGSPGAVCTNANLSATAGTTDANGVATVTYTASTTNGFCSIKATDATNSTGATATVTQTAAGAASITVAADPTSIPADGATTSVVTATVTATGGGFLAGDTVLFTTSGAACGTFTTANPSTTSATGKATVTYKASTTVGSCTVTATESSGGLSNSATIAQTAVPNNVAVTSSGTGAAPASGAATLTITATVTGGVAPNPAVSGDTVTFTLTASNTGSCGAVSPTSGTTDATGKLATTYTTSTTVGFCTVKATESGTGASGSFTIDQTSNPAPGLPFTVTATANPTSIAANGTSTSTITANVKNGAANVSADPVMFTMSGASCGSLTPTTVTTDASGNAVTTYTSSTTAGTCTITAKDAISTGSSVGTPVAQTPVPNNIAVSANPSSIRADGTSTSTITATVTTGVGGTAVSGDTVNFTAAGSPGATCTNANLSALTGTTNAAGQVTVTLTATTTVGFCTVTATETGTSQTNNTVVTEHA